MTAGSRVDARRWDALFASSSEMLVLFDAEGRCLYVSPNVGQFLGFRPEELVGGQGLDELHPDDRAKITASRERILQVSGATGLARFRLRRKDGSYRWMEAVLNNRLGDPDLAALVVNARPTAPLDQADVHDGEDAARLLLTQRELATGVARAQDIAEVAELAVQAARGAPGVDIVGLYAIEDATGDLLLVRSEGASEAFLAKTSRYPKDAPRIAWLASIDPYHGRIISAPAQAITGAEAAAEGITALSLVPLFDRGRLYGCLNVGSRTFSALPPETRDALEAIGAICAKALSEIAANRAARLAAQRYESLLRGSLDAFFVCDPTGRLIEVNDTASTVFGFTREQLLQRSMSDICPEFASRVAVLGEHGRGGLRFEATARSASGEELEMEVSAWADGEHGALLGFARDLTAQRRAQRDLRTSQELLLQAQKMEAIGRLAGGVAHDFNNLLTVINTATELAMDALQPSDPLREELMEIANAGRRAAGLTRQLLTFSRRQIVDAKVLDVDQVVADLERMLRRIIGEDIALEVRRADAPRVFADRGQLEQVIVNLAVNSRDAMPSGGALTISTSVRHVSIGELPPAAAAGPSVVVSVADTGCGMDEATMSRIFEPFFTTKGQAGTGLGLSTVYGIVKQCGGHVRVQSSPGRGTCFDVMLPLSAAPCAAPQLVVGSRAGAKTGETILLVEDERSVRDLVKNVLTTAGYEVLAASGGEEALALCKGHSGEIDLLFTDLVMPHVNGPELAARVRAMRPGIKVIYSSGYADDVLSREGMMEAGVHFVPKPLTVGRLRARVREVLDGVD